MNKQQLLLVALESENDLGLRLRGLQDAGAQLDACTVTGPHVDYTTHKGCARAIFDRATKNEATERET